MRLAIRFLFIIGLSSALSFEALADPLVLELRDVLKIARENNPLLQIQKEKLVEFEARKDLSKSPLYPELSWNLNGTYKKDAVNGSPKFEGNAYNSYGSDLKLDQTLYAKGLFSAIKLADFDLSIQSVNSELEERKLTQNIIEAFYRFILNQQNLESLLKTQDIIQKSLATSNKRYNTGRGQLLDILQVKTQLALIQPKVDQAKNQFEIAAQQLIYFMGDKNHAQFKIKGRLKTLLLKDVQKYLDLKNFRLPEYELNQLQISQLSKIRDVTLGKDFPKLSLIGDYRYDNTKKAELFSDYSHSWAVALELTIPLFSGFSSSYERSILSSREAQLQIARRDLENDLTLKQVSSFKNLETSETSLVSAESAVKLAEESQLEAARIYRLAQIDFLQFLTVQQAALEARASLDQLKFQSIVAYSNYFVASGQPLDILINILTDSGGL